MASFTPLLQSPPKQQDSFLNLRPRIASPVSVVLWSFPKSPHLGSKFHFVVSGPHSAPHLPSVCHSVLPVKTLGGL